MCFLSNITSWPPLGQITFMKRKRGAAGDVGLENNLRFTVVLESTRQIPEEPCEVAIWHNISSDVWAELELKSSPASQPMVINKEISDKCFRQAFVAEIPFPTDGKYAEFTLKYRTGTDGTWQWVNETFESKNGEIIIEPLEPLSSENPRSLQDYLHSMNDNLDVKPGRSDAAGALLWNISGHIEPAISEESKSSKLLLGTPREYVRTFSLIRASSSWLAPRHGTTDYSLKEDALVSSFVYKDGVVLVLVSVSGLNSVLTVFQSGKEGEVIISSLNDNNCAAKIEAVAAIASSFEIAMAAAIYEARKKSQGYSVTSQHIQSTDQCQQPIQKMVDNGPRPQWQAEWYDGLSYCTWNSLGRNLTEESILNTLRSLKENDIQISSLIIDDGWQSLDNKGQSQFERGMTRFEANQEGFPHGLRQTISKIRQQNQGIKHVAVWHALLGYWGGISPGGEIASKYNTIEVKRTDKFASSNIRIISPDDVPLFYNDFYEFLSSAGVDSVKTDVQSALDTFRGANVRQRCMATYQDSWSISMLRHFQARAISCMSQVPQIIFHSLLPTNKPRLVLRNSDDFFPDVESSHTWHTFCNAHNSLLTRYLNVIPDWDMFQTSHSYASFHAAARCVSGGVIYITDEPGKHDLAIIDQMTAPTTRGDTVILRPSVVGYSRDVYNNYDDGYLLKIGSFTGWARTGSGILGVFNISLEDASSLLPISDFPGVLSSNENEYVIRSHTSGNVTKPMSPSGTHSTVLVTLKPKGWDILTVYPVYAFDIAKKRESSVQGTNSQVKVAVLGLLDKMTGAAAIISSDISIVPDNDLRFNVTLKALGRLGLWISDLGERSITENFMVLLHGQPIPVETVQKGVDRGGYVLSIDILTAWRKMGLDSKWSNEVVVQVLMM
ncbi:DIN10 [Nannizzia gypsea CBS 118893]|uniref:DIN10 n=1 Tax=Arthroderma gypseum (strain ATCC MYA-4604 / CBS 118893) TaxID=535722 RepID=E4UP87_ARTGP|nr:DIN10 [Nannizzia gypsea CBS 118893]EFQ99813.1 DIN10 [Nannizzia gypsea CBS 118893]